MFLNNLPLVKIAQEIGYQQKKMLLKANFQGPFLKEKAPKEKNQKTSFNYHTMLCHVSCTK
jgi:hypothetical protein